MNNIQEITKIYNAMSENAKNDFMKLALAFSNYSKIKENKPNITHIPLWGGKKKDGSAIKWLGDHYGLFIKNPKDGLCYIFRQDILEHDNSLVNGVDREARAINQKSVNFLPTRSDKLSIAQDIPSELTQVLVALQRRNYDR